MSAICLNYIRTERDIHFPLFTIYSVYLSSGDGLIQTPRMITGYFHQLYIYLIIRLFRTVLRENMELIRDFSSLIYIFINARWLLQRFSSGILAASSWGREYCSRGFWTGNPCALFPGPRRLMYFFSEVR